MRDADGSLWHPFWEGVPGLILASLYSACLVALSAVSPPLDAPIHLFLLGLGVLTFAGILVVSAFLVSVWAFVPVLDAWGGRRMLRILIGGFGLVVLAEAGLSLV